LWLVVNSVESQTQIINSGRPSVLASVLR